MTHRERLSRQDAVGDDASSGVDADLAGREHKAAGDLRLSVGAGSAAERTSVTNKNAANAILFINLQII